MSWGKEIKCQALINSIIQEHLCKVLFITILEIIKNAFWHENIKILPSFMQRYDERQTHYLAKYVF